MEKSSGNRQVTMRDVAAEAGVNTSTVSRALSNSDLVTSETKRRVELAAEKLGYRPNPYVQAFTAHVRGYRNLPNHAPIAILDCFQKKAKHDFLSPYIEGAKARAEKLGYQIVLLSLEEIRGSLDRLRGILETRNIHGLLILPVPQNMELPELVDFPFAMATVDYSLKHPCIHRAAPSYFQNMELAIRQLGRRQHKRIVFCTTHSEIDHLGLFWMGAYTAWCTLQQHENPIRIYFDTKVDADGSTSGIEDNMELGKKDFAAWYEQEKPDAVISNKLYFHDWLLESGAKVPEDVSYVHLGGGAKERNVTCVNQNQFEVGAAALNMVIQQLQQNEYGIPDHMNTLLIYGDWEDHGSVRNRDGSE